MRRAIDRLHERFRAEEIQVDIGAGRTMVAVVTHESVQHLGLAEGSAVAAVFQASNVILSVLG